MQPTALSNQDVLKGYWKQIQGSLQSQWGQLNNDDMTRIRGDWKQMVGALQTRYGYSRSDAENRLDAFVRNWHVNVDKGRDGLDSIQDSVGDAVAEAQSKAEKMSNRAARKLRRKKKRRRRKLVLLVSVVAVAGIGYWLRENLL